MVGVILPWGKKTSFPSLPPPTSGMNGKLLWKLIPRRHLLAQFHDIVGKEMGVLALNMNSNIWNCVWTVSYWYMRKK